MARRHVDWRYFLIVLVPICIFAQETVISRHLLTTELQVGTAILRDDWGWLETPGRLRFLAATWFFAALSLLVFVLVLRDLMHPTRMETRVAAGIVLALVFTLAMIPTLEFIQNPDAPRNYQQLGGDLFEAALGKGSLPGCVVPDDRWLLGRCGDVPVISMLNRIMDMVNIFAGLGVGALIVGMILCLEKQPQGLEPRAAQLDRSLQRMRRWLYLSGLVLTSGMFYATSWMRWPLPMVAEDHVEAYAGLISESSLFTGIYFSLLILSFYLPVALVLDARKRQLILAAAEDKDLRDAKLRGEWLKTRGLINDPTDVFKSGLALAAPVLAAFAGSVPVSF